MDMAYYKGTLGLIGNTPLVEVTNIEKELGLEATVLVKLEYFNPAGSVKDRIAKAMIEDAEQKGILKEGSGIYFFCNHCICKSCIPHEPGRTEGMQDSI